MFCALMLAIASFFCPADVPTAPATSPTIVSATVLDVAHVALLHSDGSISVSTIADLLAGVDAPLVVYSLGGEGSDAGAGPHSYTTTYTSRSGSHTVTTPCGSYNTLADCATRHRAAVDALQLVFPRWPQ